MNMRRVYKYLHKDDEPFVRDSLINTEDRYHQLPKI